MYASTEWLLWHTVVCFKMGKKNKNRSNCITRWKNVMKMSKTKKNGPSNGKESNWEQITFYWNDFIFMALSTDRTTEEKNRHTNRVQDETSSIQLFLWFIYIQFQFWLGQMKHHVERIEIIERDRMNSHILSVAIT